MKIKKILKLFCESCPVNHICNTTKGKCHHLGDFKKLLEEHEAEKKPKIIMCPNCLYIFDPKDPIKKPDHLPTKKEGFEITNKMIHKALRDIKDEQKKETDDKPELKISVQLEIEYNSISEWNYETGYPHLINAIKTYFENDITIPETEKLNFKHLDKVRISKIIQ